MAAGWSSSGRRRLRIGVYDLYWSTLGGGEQVDGSIAQVLAADHDVTLLGPQPVDVDATPTRLGVDLSACCDASPVSTTDVRRGQRRLRPVRQRHLPQQGGQPGTARLLLRALPRRGADHAAIISAAVWASSASRRCRCRRDCRSASPRCRPRSTGGWSASSSSRRYTRYLAELAVHGRLGRAAVGRSDRRALPARPTRPCGPATRQPLILVLGRFFDPSFGHSKKQHELLATFRTSIEPDGSTGWRMAIVGGCDAANRDVRTPVRRDAIGLPGRGARQRARQRRRAIARRSVDLLARRRARRGSGSDIPSVSSTSASPSSRPWPPARSRSCSVPPAPPRSCATASTGSTGAPSMNSPTRRSNSSPTTNVADALSDAATRRAHDFSADAFADRLGQFVSDDTTIT